MGAIIPSVKNEDIANCAELYVQVFNANPWNDSWTVETAFGRLHDIFVGPHFAGALYMDGNELIKGAIFGNCEQFFDGTHYNLKEMFVAPELQGMGIGGRLLRALEKQLRGLGVSTVYLFTSKGNRTSEFYQKNGFTAWESMVMMGKDLG